MAANIPEISLPAEPILEIGNLPITNAFIATLFVSLLLLLIGIKIGRRPTLVPSRGQLMIEMIIQFFLGQLKNAYGTDHRSKKHLPYILTLFLFIFIANQFSIFPLLSSIINEGGTPVFRTPTSHYSLPIAMALLSVGTANLIAFSVSPLRYIGKFIKIGPILKARSLSEVGMAFIDFFIGLLDIIGECAKIISMSSRLFGNILSGEIMILIIASLSFYTQFLVPVPFMILSIASGMIQAFVFTLLALNFMAGTIPEPKKIPTSD